MAGVLENRIQGTCFQKRANRHRVGIGRGLLHETKREFDHITETRRHDLAVLDRDALDLHDKRALARHAPFSGVIPTTVPIRVALAPALDMYRRWALLRRCLRERDQDLTLRVAGTPVLLYAQIPTHIVELTAEDIVTDDTGTHLILHTVPVLVPLPLAALTTELLETNEQQPRLRSPGDPVWLFPGSRPGTHFSGGRCGCQRVVRLVALGSKDLRLSGYRIRVGRERLVERLQRVYEACGDEEFLSSAR